MYVLLTAWEIASVLYLASPTLRWSTPGLAFNCLLRTAVRTLENSEGGGDSVGKTNPRAKKSLRIKYRTLVQHGLVSKEGDVDG